MSIGGAHAIRRYLERLKADGSDVKLAGLVDAGQEDVFRRAVDHIEVELAVARSEDVAGGVGWLERAGRCGAVVGDLDAYAPEAALVGGEVESRLVEPAELVRRAGDHARAAARRGHADVDLRPERRRHVAGE